MGGVEKGIMYPSQITLRILSRRARGRNHSLIRILSAALRGFAEKLSLDILKWSWSCAPQSCKDATNAEAVGPMGRSGFACSSYTLEPSHVLLAMGINRDQGFQSFRVSLGRKLTQKEFGYLYILPLQHLN